MVKATHSWDKHQNAADFVSRERRFRELAVSLRRIARVLASESDRALLEKAARRYDELSDPPKRLH
jgi:hypothetical protein